MKQYSLCPRICCRPGQYLVTDEQDKFYVRPPQPSRERWYLTVIRLIGPQGGAVPSMRTDLPLLLSLMLLSLKPKRSLGLTRILPSLIQAGSDN
jgi:hypothetical protein